MEFLSDSLEVVCGNCGDLLSGCDFFGLFCVVVDYCNWFVFDWFLCFGKICYVDWFFGDVVFEFVGLV